MHADLNEDRLRLGESVEELPKTTLGFSSESNAYQELPP